MNVESWPVTLTLACPICQSVLSVKGAAATCATCQQTFARREGIWRFLPQSRACEFADFLREYQTVRADEDWGAADADYYRTLPHVGKDDPQRNIWRIRARSFERLLTLIGNGGPVKILDVGAGNGWLANQLGRRGHTVAALDLADDSHDGLGARVHYAASFETYQAEFDRMPFGEAQFDMVIFNAALHYARALSVTLREARRVMRSDGSIIVMDSPFYSRPSSGAAMLAEREASFAHKYGFNRQVRTIGFLTRADLEQSAAEAGLEMDIWAEDNRWAARLRRTWIERRTGREPARFPVVMLKHGKFNV
jgi:ubiquinone/menaquinone biosynthesis C-methylase UbiE